MQDQGLEWNEMLNAHPVALALRWTPGVCARDMKRHTQKPEQSHANNRSWSIIHPTSAWLWSPCNSRSCRCSNKTAQLWQAEAEARAERP